MYSWYSWIVEIDALKWYLNALFTNELKGNSDALGYADFSNLQESYGWNSSYKTCVMALLVIFFLLKFLTFLGLKYLDHTSA
jgi:hypothetical protein